MRNLATHTTILALSLLGANVAFAQAPNTSSWVEKARAGEWLVMSFKDVSVYDRDGKEVGKTVNFLMNPQGQISAAIVDIGALTHEAKSEVAVPFDQFQISEAGATSAEDLGRGGDAPEVHAEPKLSGPDGGAVAGAVAETRKSPGRLTLKLSGDEIRAAKRFQSTR